MIMQVKEGYQEYKRIQEENEFKKIKLGGLLIAIFSIITYIIINLQNSTMVWHDILLVSIMIGLILSSLITVGISETFNKLPELDDFVFLQIKNKSEECFWLNGQIHFKSENKFYKVEKFQEMDGVLKVISEETKPWRVDTIQ